MSDDVPAGSTTGEVSDAEYLRQLGVEPRFKRALGFLTGSLFAVAFQGLAASLRANHAAQRHFGLQ